MKMNWVAINYILWSIAAFILLITGEYIPGILCFVVAILNGIAADIEIIKQRGVLD